MSKGYRYERSAELQRCLDLCVEFSERAAIVEACIKSDVPGTFPKQHAALKRTSLELTRALAEYRRTGAMNYVVTD